MEMFHTYVLSGCNTQVDIDRAAFLMDHDLWEQAQYDMQQEKKHPTRRDATYDAQWVWDHYCSLHFKKYQVSFQPDCDPDWGG
jgi:hypothetical protein